VAKRSFKTFKLQRKSAERILLPTQGQADRQTGRPAGVCSRTITNGPNSPDQPNTGMPLARVPRLTNICLPDRHSGTTTHGPPSSSLLAVAAARIIAADPDSAATTRLTRAGGTRPPTNRPRGALPSARLIRSRVEKRRGERGTASVWGHERRVKRDAGDGRENSALVFAIDRNFCVAHSESQAG
jgi:hypothetical protein